MSAKPSKENFMPGSDADAEDIFKYPFTTDDQTIKFLRDHGQIMFIIRGPAGTGKDSLAQMLSSRERYPNAVVCSADSYFSNTFSTGKRNSDNLRQSHEYCYRKVETSCKKKIHPIIVKNTHMRKRELQPYLDFAADYNYTVIIASTIHKFVISPEILAKSNTKGLGPEYFMNRLKQWQDVFPTLVGWFLSPDDSSCLINELQIALDFLLGDGKFCRILNSFEIGKVLEYYQVKQLLYCIAACSEKNNCFDLKNYYNSDNVKEYYGHCFTLNILGFLISTSDIFAIVHLETNLKDLHQNSTLMEKTAESNLEDLPDLQSLNISGKFLSQNFKKHHKTIAFPQKSNYAGKTVVTKKWEDEYTIDTRSCSCIHLAKKWENEYSFDKRSFSSIQAKGRNSLPITLPWELKKNFHQLLAGAANNDGIILEDQFGELESKYRYCRLPKNAWVLRTPSKITVKSVFTGMYV